MPQMHGPAIDMNALPSVCVQKLSQDPALYAAAAMHNMSANIAVFWFRQSSQIRRGAFSHVQQVV